MCQKILTFSPFHYARIMYMVHPLYFAYF